MIEVDLKISQNVIGNELEKIKKQLNKLPQDSLQEFKALTPIRSGNARRKTTLSGDKIQANYPYAQRLDEGWSKQAPRGMTQPFEKWLQERLKKILGR